MLDGRPVVTGDIEEAHARFWQRFKICTGTRMSPLLLSLISRSGEKKSANQMRDTGVSIIDISGLLICVQHDDHVLFNQFSSCSVCMMRLNLDVSYNLW